MTQKRWQPVVAPLVLDLPERLVFDRPRRRVEVCANLVLQQVTKHTPRRAVRTDRIRVAGRGHGPVARQQVAKISAPSEPRRRRSARGRC